MTRLENDVSGLYEILSRVEKSQVDHGHRLDSMDGRLDHLGGQMATVIDLLEGK